jgi:hypothetical protein
MYLIIYFIKNINKKIYICKQVNLNLNILTYLTNARFKIQIPEMQFKLNQN